MTSGIQEAALESTFQKIARIIARRYGVTVSIRGSSAYVDLGTESIVLPSLAYDQDLEFEHLDGFLDHECAHVIFTSREVEKEAREEKTLYDFWNGVEDVWIERAMGSRFIGCHQNMERLNTWLYEIFEKRWLDIDPLGRLLYALERCYRGEHDKERYADDPMIGGIIMQLQEDIDRARVCNSTHEALAIARSIHERIKDLAKSQGEEQDDDSGRDGSGDGDSGDGDFDSDDSSGSQESHEGCENCEKSGGGTDRSREEALRIAGIQARSFLEREASGGFAKPLDVEALVNEQITDFIESRTEGDPDRYVVFSGEFDYDTTYSANDLVSMSDEYRSLREEVGQYVGNLANVLELMLAAESEDRWVGGSRRGKKFDQRRLSYWAEGADDDRIFKSLEEGIRHNTAISMLWDCSGSMGSSSVPERKASLARLAAVACHEALIRCKSIAHEVLGFNTGGETHNELVRLVDEAKSRGEDLSRFSRLAELDARMVFVPFGSSDGRAIVQINGGAANRDGECVLWAAKRLARRPEKRKVLLVGSDGHPQGAIYSSTERRYLREVVQRTMSTGIEVYGVGIMDSAVASYYPSYEVIRDIQDLPRAMMALLIRSLPRGHSDERVARI